jgi:hypothetical protein
MREALSASLRTAWVEFMIAIGVDGTRYFTIVVGVEDWVEMELQGTIP